MRQVSLREFRTRGAKALESVPKGETILLSGQQGPAYFHVPDHRDQEVGRSLLAGQQNCFPLWHRLQGFGPPGPELSQRHLTHGSTLHPSSVAELATLASASLQRVVA